MNILEEKTPKISQTICNFRDLGGHATASGATVTPGRLFRSSQLSNLPTEALRTLQDVGVRIVYDFRTWQEREQSPDAQIDGARNVWLNVLGDASDSLAATLQLMLQDPRKAAQELTPTRIQTLYRSIYEDLVTLPSACKAYAAFFSLLLRDPGSPKLFHCTAGKDRTGWAAALFLSLLGVGFDDIVADYLTSNDQLISGSQPMMQAFVAGGGDGAVVENLLRVRREYLDIAFDALTRNHGTVGNYFSQALGIGKAEQAALISAYTSG
ncbi:tyrosine-protein phosphatase [Bordetella sp. 02P26C-1]|uniref:tyrosine-protein phosphatase n=1 Tax=Bordetella sp. 02P26C-1 TaxID=2683195 RepID=UPI0013534FF4|nr:tyrosine-protein phosphatase [Bordetella sp. 02P26C-1]MVW77534.1 protein-tyrosine-phosphatase [Bordetella sp. 02P26C-1]